MVLINHVHRRENMSNVHSSDYSNFSNIRTKKIIDILHQHFPKNIHLASSFGFSCPQAHDASWQ